MMLGLSKKSEYALLALSYILDHGAAIPVRARDIADRFGIPTELLAKILQRLARVGVLRSTPGPTGGYVLALPAEEITVGSTVRAVEGTTGLVRCIRADAEPCERLPLCTIKDPMERINMRVNAVLDRIPISEISRRTDEPSEFLTLQRLSVGPPTPAPSVDRRRVTVRLQRPTEQSEA